MYKELIFGIIKKYGRVCDIVSAEGDVSVSVKAMINPLLYKNKMYLNDVYIPDGCIDKGSYLYIGDPDVNFENFPMGTVVRCGNNEYTIMRTEQYFVENTAVYTWAILQLRRRNQGNVQ